MMAPGNRASQQTARRTMRLQTSPPLRGPAGLGTRLLPIRVTSKIPSCLVACAIYAALGAVDTSPVAALLRRRVPWRSWDLFNVVVPFCAWTGLMSSGLSTGSKRLSNLSLEPANARHGSDPRSISPSRHEHQQHGKGSIRSDIGRPVLRCRHHFLDCRGTTRMKASSRPNRTAYRPRAPLANRRSLLGRRGAG
jgi:hypothetical protein